MRPEMPRLEEFPDEGPVVERIQPFEKGLSKGDVEGGPFSRALTRPRRTGDYGGGGPSLGGVGRN